MSYDLMVFNQLKVPYKSAQLNQWLCTSMENDAPIDNPPVIFHAFMENIQKIFPPINHCPENKPEYACDYEIHEDFIYMCFGYSVAREAHDIVKRQAKIDQLGFWDVSQTFDRTFPITLPTDKWPMILEANWIKYGSLFVYHFEEVRKVLMQMKTVGRSSVCLTDRYGNYIQAGGYKELSKNSSDNSDKFIVEVRKYIDAVTYQHIRADLKKESSDADTLVRINDFTVKAPNSQILSQNQVCLLFQEFTDEIKPENLNIFWKELKL